MRRGRYVVSESYVVAYELLTMFLLSACPYLAFIGRRIGRMKVKEDAMSSVTRTQDGTMGGSHVVAAVQLAGARSRLLKAFIFEILVILVNLIGALAMVGATIGMATEDNFTGATLYFGYLSDLGPAALLVTGLVLTVILAIRTWRMLDAANSNNVQALRNLSSLGWAVTAIFSSYILTGILLLRVNRSIGELDV